MRVNKISICVTTLITISSLAIAITLNYFCFEFVANTLIGVFASGFLALILAINPIIKARHVITEKCFYFREYRKAIRGNTQVMRQFLQDIAEVLLSVTTKEGFNGMGKSMVMEFTHNKLVEDLRSELDGEFYKLMYPLKRKEDYHAD